LESCFFLSCLRPPICFSFSSHCLLLLETPVPVLALPLQVLYAKSNDLRGESFERASLVASSFARHTRGLLLHMSMAHAGLTVLPSAGGGDAK
jgi:hypothetical protein